MFCASRRGIEGETLATVEGERAAMSSESVCGLRKDQGQAMNEFESALFVPVVILPSQICVDAQWSSDTSGPVALMLAVLEEAARCIERGRRRRHPGLGKLATEAEAWVRCDSREWPFAFA